MSKIEVAISEVSSCASFADWVVNDMIVSVSFTNKAVIFTSIKNANAPKATAGLFIK
jgi:hypothetical protein